MSDRFKYWTFVVYPESAPGNWKELLKSTQIPCAISPAHDADENENTIKQHFHVLLEFHRACGAKRARDACCVCGGANGFVKAVLAPLGMYEYLTHKNNPEKQQFGDCEPELLNGFSVPHIQLDDEAMFDECMTLIFDNNILEFSHVVKYFRDGGMSEKASWVLRHSYGIKTLCDSQRYSLLKRKADGELTELRKRLDELDKKPTKLSEKDRKKGWCIDSDGQAPFGE